MFFLPAKGLKADGRNVFFPILFSELFFAFLTVSNGNTSRICRVDCNFSIFTSYTCLTGSIEVVDFTLGNRTPYFKYARAYDNHDDQRKLKASELNFNHPPDDLMTRGKYQAVIHLDAGLTSPEARFIIRIRLGNKGYEFSIIIYHII